MRWRHLSFIMQGSMSVLNPVRRVRRSFEDFAARHMDGREPPANLSAGLGDPDGVARVLAFLASDDAAFVRGTLFTR